jgi:arylformamidase
MIYDISRTITPALAVWPGDATFSFTQALAINNGDSVNLTTLSMSAHTGTHADAPWHYLTNGAHPADLPIEKYAGQAYVITIPRQHGGITPADFAGHNTNGLKRVLIHTWVSDVPDNQWPDDFPYPTVELIDWLGDMGAVLIGVDMPSVDRFDSKDLPCHRRLYERGMVNLESVRLAGVPDGVYDLAALPLKIAGVCASPVRAILRSIEVP